jgi:hypothetical protein
MKTIARIAIAGIFFFGAAICANATENLQDFAYRSKIETDGKGAWFQADIPIAVRWQAKYFDLRDLRVFNADGEALPFALTASSEQLVQDRREVSGKLFPLYATSIESEPDLSLDGGLHVRRDSRGNVDIEVLPGTHTPSQRKPNKINKVLRGWLIDASAADFPLKRLKLDWAAGEEEGFFRFSIEASDDLEHWRHWGEGQLVRLVFDGQSILQREISLPGGKARYLRLLWENPQAAPSVSGANLSGEVTHTEDARLVWSSPLAGDAVPEKEREYIWHFPFNFTPQRVRVVMAEDNVLAPVVFYGRDVQPISPKSANSANSAESFTETGSAAGSSGLRLRDVLRDSGHRQHKRISPSPSEAPWQTLANGVLYRLPAKEGIQMENELEFPGFPVNQLRLRIDRRGSGLGHGAPRIELALQNVELTFLPRGKAPYWLAVGNTDAQAAVLPLTTLIPGGIAQARQTGQLGHARILESDATGNAPALAPDASTHPPSRGSGKIILWAILGIGVFLLAAMAFSLARSMKKESKTTGY